MMKLRRVVLSILCICISFCFFEIFAQAITIDYDRYNFSWVVYKERTSTGRGTNRKTTWNYYFDFDHGIVAYVYCLYNGYSYTYTYEYDIYKLEEQSDGIICIVDQYGEKSDVYFRFEGKIFKNLRACDSEGELLATTETTDAVGRKTRMKWYNDRIKEQPPLKLSDSGFYQKYPAPQHCLAKLNKK